MITDVATNPALPANPTHSFPIVFVDDLDAVRTFYRDTLGLPLTVDLPYYVQVQLTPAGTEGPELAFKTSASPDVTFVKGFVLSIPVADADAVERACDAAGVPVSARAEDKPWGWRSMHVTDPAGVVLDFFHTLPTVENA